MRKSLIPRPNFIIALLSTAALFLISALATILVTLEKPIVAQMNSQVYQILELDDKAESLRSTIMDKILGHADVDSSTVQWRSGEDAVDFMVAETGIEFALDGDIPFSDMVTFQSKSLYNPDFLELEKSLDGIRGVQETFFQHTYFETVKNTIRRWKKILIGAAIVFIIIAFTILSGLFRLILYAERKKIKTMELVGATQWYVIRPYLWRFLMIGVISITMACAVFGAIWYYYLKKMEIDWALFFNQSSLIMVGLVWLLLLLGILLISISLIRSFMNKTLEDLA